MLQVNRECITEAINALERYVEHVRSFAIQPKR